MMLDIELEIITYFRVGNATGESQHRTGHEHLERADSLGLSPENLWYVHGEQESQEGWSLKELLRGQGGEN